MLHSWWEWRKRTRLGLLATATAMTSGVAVVSLVAGAVSVPAAWAGTVTVQPGQNLTQIAGELHTTVAALEAANGLADPNRVLAGELLQIPSANGGAGFSTASVVVQPGQTLTSIAARYGVSVAALAKANGLANPNRVLAGALLEVPGGSGGAGGASGTTTVRVQPGQTLTAIAARYAVSVAALAAANGLRNPNFVMAGTTLVVPGVSGPGSSGPGSSGPGSSGPGSSDMALADYTTPVAGTVAVGGLPTQLAAHPDRLTLEPDFAAAAVTYGVPLPLLEALCWWESGWQAAIVSSTGAVGVCQIEPATAGFVDEYLAQSALNPEVASQNIDLGAAYLGSLLRATGGNVAEALAGYYQGLASVRQHGMAPATANYVKGIEAYTAIFAAG